MRNCGLLFASVLLAGMPHLAMPPMALAAVDTKVLTLPTAIQASLAIDPRVRQAELDLERAGVGAQGAKAEQWQYSGDVSLSNWTGATNLLSPSDPIQGGSVPIGNAQVSARVPIFSGWRLQSQITAAEATVQAAKAQLDRVRQELVFSVTEAFWQACRAEMHRDIQREAVEKASQVRDMVVSSAKLGKATGAEVDRAEVALLNEESARLKNESEAAQARDRLGGLLRQDLGDAVFGGNTASEAPVFPATAAEVAKAIEARPDIRLAQTDVAIKRANLGVSAADRWPQAELMGLYQHGNNPFYATSQNRTVLNRLVGTANAQVTLSYHLFDHGVIDRRVAASQLELASSEQALAATRTAAELEVKQARRYLDLTNRRLTIGARSETLAAKNLKWVEGRFQFGYALLTELNEARLTLVSARNQRLDAEIDHQIAVASMKRAFGRLEAPPPAHQTRPTP